MRALINDFTASLSGGAPGLLVALLQNTQASPQTYHLRMLAMGPGITYRISPTGEADAQPRGDPAFCACDSVWDLRAAAAAPTSLPTQTLTLCCSLPRSSQFRKFLCALKAGLPWSTCLLDAEPDCAVRSGVRSDQRAEP